MTRYMTKKEKTMKVLIDTNILLDVLTERDGFWEESLAIWNLCRDEKLSGFISALSIPNIIYIMRKSLTPEKTDDLIRKMSVLFKIVDLKASDITEAAQMLVHDFEDGVQMSTAKRIQADYIVTRNTRDFLSSDVPCIEPAEMLKIL